VAARVLIAEDEETILESLEFLMKRCGYELRSARDGDDALRAVAEFRPQLVLLDLMLPLRSGLEVCRAIRANPAWRATKVLMITAKGGTHDMALGMQSGADGFVMKPFSTRELAERVGALLAQP
jgi:two-component system, OmpR family, alkaline phosphatase synthesis response regulator PhoP